MSIGILQELRLVNYLYLSKNTPPHPSWTFLKEYQPNIILRRRDDIKGELVSLLWHSVTVQIYRYLCLLLNMNTKIVTVTVYVKVAECINQTCLLSDSVSAVVCMRSPIGTNETRHIRHQY